ncbi:MAG: LamG domain-containing protein [Anaerolineae bacterium]|nr:LamG domain-containing protein [Anaerolineae bacterium]
MTGATPMIENAWNHIMLTYADGEQRLYINGSLSASQPQRRHLPEHRHHPHRQPGRHAVCRRHGRASLLRLRTDAGRDR